MHFLAECLDCGHCEPYHPTQAVCSKCGSGWRMATYDYAAIAPVLLDRLKDRPFTLWRYAELLPVENPSPDHCFAEGGTPLIRANNLGLMLGCPHIYMKDERQGPTASFKDRQAALTITALKEAGITEVVISSTGNVAISYSAYAARAGIKLWAFLTSLVPTEKMREVAIYGTQVVKVTATYDQTKNIAGEFARERGFYLDRGTRSIPSVEAMKTLAYEIAEQCTPIMNRLRPQPYTAPVEQETGPKKRPAPAWRAPDWYIQAVSGGLGPVGVQKGFREMLKMGLIDRAPRFAIIQSEGCNPMVRAWREDAPVARPVLSPSTHITTLSTGDPGRSYTLLYDYLKTYGGAVESVTDEEAFRALHIAAKMEGMSVEPATGVAFAGLIKLVRMGVIKPTDVVVLNVTGHTMPIESHVLGDNWSRDVAIPETVASAAVETVATASPEEGLLAALSKVTPEKYAKVLVVDDHPEARRLIMRILQSQGEYVLVQASDGQEAISVARQEIPDLIILDLMMPQVDGFTVLDALREDPKTAAIPVIVVTAKELTPKEKQRLSGRIQSLMQKGDFMDTELLNEIQLLVDVERKPTTEENKPFSRGQPSS